MSLPIDLKVRAQRTRRAKAVLLEALTLDGVWPAAAEQLREGEMVDLRPQPYAPGSAYVLWPGVARLVRLTYGRGRRPFPQEVRRRYRALNPFQVERALERL